MHVWQSRWSNSIVVMRLLFAPIVARRNEPGQPTRLKNPILDRNLTLKRVRVRRMTVTKSMTEKTTTSSTEMRKTTMMVSMTTKKKNMKKRRFAPPGAEGESVPPLTRNKGRARARLLPPRLVDVVRLKTHTLTHELWMTKPRRKRRRESWSRLCRPKDGSLPQAMMRTRRLSVSYLAPCRATLE